MSEVSQSFHLQGVQQADAVNLLRLIGRPGWVFPAIGQWVTFVAVAGATTWWLWDAPGTSDVDIWLDWTGTLLAHGPPLPARARLTCDVVG